MKIEYVDVNDVIPYHKNPRKNMAAVEVVKTSLKEYGFKQPIVLDNNYEIIVGHTRFSAALDLGMTTVPVLIADDLDDDQIRAYRIMDNRSSEYSEWDDALLIQEIEKLSDIDIELTGFTQEDIEKLIAQDDLASMYTDRIEIPHYIPKGENPHESELVDTDFAEQLKDEIANSDVPQEIKNFLMLAANRHNVFDYHKIAEYYCHADKKVQNLIEKSALVLIDFDKAIEQGFVRLTDSIKIAHSEEHGD